MIDLTLGQRHLMRSALGLLTGPFRLGSYSTHFRRACSYRNRFAAAVGTRDYAAWREIVNFDLARRIPWFYSYGDHFFLTRRGAELVLHPGELLDPEDFE